MKTKDERLGTNVLRILLATIVSVILTHPQRAEARTFHCRGGDVACLIAAIKQANVQPGPRHEIRLAAGTYTLTAVDNETDGPNGLPSITGQLTIKGVGTDITIRSLNERTLPLTFVWRISRRRAP